MLFPASAVRFSQKTRGHGAMAADRPATRPISITALSGEVVTSWYWGRCLHDLSGMQLNGPSIPLDYCHDDAEVLGLCDKFDTSAGRLDVSAELVPFSAEDRASEIAYKADQGVPYQASIFFDPRTVKVEELDAGQVAQCNGKQVEGPLMIFRQWSLRGVAICPYGVDQNTSSQFCEAGEFSIPITRSETTMSVENTNAAPAEPAATQATPQTPPAAAEPAAAITAAEPVAVAQPAMPVASATTGQQAAQPADARKEEGKRFLDTFGDKGGRWFAEGLSFEEAQTKFNLELRAENEELKKRMAGAQLSGAAPAANGAVTFGEEKPLSFDPVGTDANASKLTEAQTRYGKGFGAFVAGIKMPTSR